MWSPLAWSLWTAALYRPGRLDDEEVPDGADGLTPWWHHTDTRGGGRLPATRPDWPMIVFGQSSLAPALTDDCNARGACNGACRVYEVTP